MIMQDSEELTNLIHQSACLRGLFKFEESIGLIENKLAEMHPDCLTVAYLEIIKASAESGDIEKTKKYAHLLNKIEPGLPTIQKYLK